MTNTSNDQDNGYQLVDVLVLAVIGGLIAFASFVALITTAITVIVLARTKRYWYAAAALAAAPLALMITRTRDNNPDLWFSDTYHAPFRARHVWINDQTPTIGEVWNQTHYLQGWLTASLLLGVLTGLTFRILIDIGFFNPDAKSLNRIKPSAELATDIPLTRPTWDQYPSIN